MNVDVRVFMYMVYCILSVFLIYNIDFCIFIFMYILLIICVIDLFRYGGFFFGDEDLLVVFNVIELKIVIDELLFVLNNGIVLNLFNEI